MSRYRSSAEEAVNVYEILVTQCGAPDRDLNAFVGYMTDDTGFAKEWRFGGRLGFGGKCRTNSNHPLPYVDCYPEDSTPARLAMIDRANQRITALFGQPKVASMATETEP